MKFQVESRRFKLHYKDVTSRETNVFNFVRLVVVRLIYGVATMMGFEEGISDFANGALVPPGVDDDYGGDIGGVDDDRDYDYDY